LRCTGNKNAYHSFARLLNIFSVDCYLAENSEPVLRSYLVMLLVYPQQAKQQGDPLLHRARTGTYLLSIQNFMVQIEAGVID
jgi:hypothetical protein